MRLAAISKLLNSNHLLAGSPHLPLTLSSASPHVTDETKEEPSGLSLSNPSVPLKTVDLKLLTVPFPILQETLLAKSDLIRTSPTLVAIREHVIRKYRSREKEGAWGERRETRD
ncbi:hypothetical protein TNCV_3012631 [Trichonephila clavipes]|nr:hypothetical protein TNCV_3012631 [Trichonephila clavipes]